MEFRVGVPVMGSKIMDAAVDKRGVGVLISANSLWNGQRRQFELPRERILRDGTIAGFDGETLSRRNVALDSAGYVAMKLYGGNYPWSVEQYVRLGGDSGEPGSPWGNYGWAWYSAMDLCCEPEIAANAAEVHARVVGTADLLDEMYQTIDWWRSDEGEGAYWFRDPMPILQGWRPVDYVESARCTNAVLRARGRQWPDMVGVGSVCRRQIRGPDGLLRVLGALDLVLPSHVRLHLFGVKGTALAILRDNPRVGSVDSCAWDYTARVEARRQGVSKTNAFRLAVMDRWLAAQHVNMAAGPQLDLFATAEPRPA